jgi:tetratricopeptide (TPR) repeat protein
MTHGRPAFLACLALALAASLSACGGPLPPEDPFYLGSAKDELSRGNHWYLRGCNREAARFYQEALTSARLSDSVPHIVMALNALGAVRLAEGDLGGAAGYLDEALGLSSSEPGNPELAAVMGNLGTLAWRAGRRPDALEFWEEAAARAASLGESPATYLASLARARVDASGAVTPEFRDALARAVTAAAEPGTPDTARADVLNLQARGALATGRAAEALTYLVQALEIDRRLESQSGLAEDLEIAAAIASETGDGAGAASSLERAFYLRAALSDNAGMARVMAALRASAAEHGLPKSLAPMERVMKDPKLFNPMEDRCP